MCRPQPPGQATCWDSTVSPDPPYPHGSPQPLPATTVTLPTTTAPRPALVTFGRTDPLHLTERFIARYGVPDYYDILRGTTYNHQHFLRLLPLYPVVYCGTGATMFEALLAGCDVRVISSPELDFAPAFSVSPQYDHSLRPVYWTAASLEAMFREIKERR